MISTAQLEIEFQADIGEVLIVGLGKFVVEDANIEDTFFDVARGLYAIVDCSHLSIRHNHQKQGRSALGVHGKSVDRRVDFRFKVLWADRYMLTNHVVGHIYPQLSEYDLEAIHFLDEVCITIEGIPTPLE